MSESVYENPLITRYASRPMAALWGAQRRHATWRRLWVALAEAEHELGLPVTREQVEALREKVEEIDFGAVAAYEKRLRHDVMAHVHAYGDAVPEARGIVHLGATSCFVTDNADLMLMREGLEFLRGRLAATIDRLATFAVAQRDVATLGMTHLQPAQPTTVGKRACLWAYDLVLDLDEVEARLAALKARGVKGTTGTQASFLGLFDGDHGKVEELERRVAEKIGFSSCYAVTGQTYPRKVDAQVLNCLSGVAQSAHKAANDLRILQHRKEVEEPFEADQIGSSAMPYKRNPMRAERICGLARYVTSLESSAAQTLSTQWMERTLDDSANRRLVIPQAFLGVDAILVLYQNVASGLVVYPEVIRKNLAAELPFMASEEILLAATALGGDRQELHERIRQHAQAAGDAVKREGKENDLLTRLAADEAFAGVDLSEVLEPQRYVGRAPEQVDAFVRDCVEPVRAKYANALASEADVRV